MRQYSRTPGSQNGFTPNGFTLVELAIALMVIGLLIGGILKGQELVENARVTKLMRQFKAYETAATIFTNSYGALPGDLKDPGQRLPNCTAATCNETGNKNRMIDSNAEAYNFFPHMVKAGLLQGTMTGVSSYPISGSETYDMVFAPTDYDAYLIVQQYLNNNTFSGGWFPSRAMAQMDRKTDDGKPSSGDMIVQDGGGGSTPCLDSSSGETLYNETASGGGQHCYLMLIAAF